MLRAQSCAIAWVAVRSTTVVLAGVTDEEATQPLDCSVDLEHPTPPRPVVATVIHIFVPHVTETGSARYAER